jgi:hypothetical protein
VRKLGGPWDFGTPLYTFAGGRTEGNESEGYLGGSSDLSRIFIEPGIPLRSSDAAISYGSMYEIAGLGTESPRLRLVNVDNGGNELELSIASGEGPLLGDSGEGVYNGTNYHAISESGRTVFLTATPHAGVATVYARIHCEAGSSPTCKEDNEGYGAGERSNESLETVAVSNPSPSGCENPDTHAQECVHPAPKPAAFQGASADGSKVFFTTEQELVPADTDETYDLYEYDFKKREKGENPLTLISKGTEAPKTYQDVAGVVRTSSDGSHVYFTATAVLTTVPNKNGEAAQAGNTNLYGYDTETDQIKFVAQVSSALAGEDEISHDTERHAQTTPDGRYLVFSAPGPLLDTGDTNGTAQAVYRYDFQTEEVTWISHPAPGFTPTNEKEPALVSPMFDAGNGGFAGGSPGGSEADSEDWNRAISENGEYIIFTTAERLQADDEDNALNVYEWHNGTVGKISTGDAEKLGRQPAATMSASGSDIFFFSSTQLVGQDTDDLVDIYDARVDGGFPAPAHEPSCSGEACQPSAGALPSFGPTASSLSAPGGNLTARAGTLALVTVKPKPLTRTQQLAKALKACQGKPRKQRAACQSKARKKYGAKAKAKKVKAKAKKSGRRGK